MDRNRGLRFAFRKSLPVALRKESVDRNLNADGSLKQKCVALRKESVDRNQRIAKPFREQFKVALSKESVDRNGVSAVVLIRKHLVALRKESVDRNPCVAHAYNAVAGRSPQGERG